MRFELRNERHGLRLPPTLLRYEKRRERQRMVPLAIREHWQELAEKANDDNRAFDEYMAAINSTMLLEDYKEWQAEPYHSDDDWDDYHNDEYDIHPYELE